MSLAMGESQFLMRPRPLEGESLSSWRQRSGWANGYNFFPTIDERTRRVDPDIGANSEDLIWLSDAHQLTLEEVKALSLAGYIGRLVKNVDGVKHPRFWLRARLRSRVNSYGPMFCPHCLGEDEDPYFRLAWRFAFVTECGKHQVELLDQCPSCMSPGWPTAVGETQDISKKFISHRYCWKCGFDLSKSTTSESRNGVGAVLSNGIDTGELKLGALAYPILDVLQAIRGVCHIFIRDRERKAIISANSKWSEIARGLNLRKVNPIAIDYASVHERNLLVPVAYDIVKDWPDSYREFANQNNLSAMNLGVNGALQPEWMNALIANEFRKVQKTTETCVVIAFCNEWLARTGNWPTRKDVRDKFGPKAPDKGIATVFKARLVATEAESNLFYERLHQQLSIAMSNKKDGQTRLLDYATLLLANLRQKSLSEIANETVCIKPELQHALSMVDVAPKCEKASLEVIDLLESRTRPQDREQINRPISHRQLQRRTTMLMKGMDVLLAREPMVFSN